MIDSDNIAQIKLIRVIPAGNRLPVQIQIGKPHKKATGWECPTSVEGLGLQNSTPALRGENSLQSLCLALKLVGKLLDDCIGSGDRFFYEHEDGDTNDHNFEFDSYFGKL